MVTLSTHGAVVLRLNVVLDTSISFVWDGTMDDVGSGK